HRASGGRRVAILGNRGTAQLRPGQRRALRLHMSAGHVEIAAILGFWFHEPGHPEWERMRDAWWTKDAAFDESCLVMGRDLHARAMGGAFDHCSETPRGALALVVLCDQFP